MAYLQFMMTQRFHRNSGLMIGTTDRHGDLPEALKLPVKIAGTRPRREPGKRRPELG
jgi:hypothetical protein